MKIRPVSDSDRDTWPTSERYVFGALEGMEATVQACEALVDANAEVHVPWQPDEIDLVRLAHGGTVWLTTIGSLPPHVLEVRGGER